MKKLVATMMMVMIMALGMSVQANAAFNPFELFDSEETKFFNRQYDNFEEVLEEEGHEVNFSSTRITTFCGGNNITSRYFSINDKAYDYVMKWKSYNDDVYNLIEVWITDCNNNDEKYTIDEFVRYLS